MPKKQLNAFEFRFVDLVLSAAISVRSASEHMLSSDWLNKNKTWVEQFSTKAKRLRNAVRGQTTQQRQPIPPQTVLTSSAEHELTASYGDLDLGSPRNDQPLRSKTFHHLSPNHGQRGGSLQVDPSGNNRSTQCEYMSKNVSRNYSR